VPLVEEGWWENDIALRIAEEYLLPLKEKNIGHAGFGMHPLSPFVQYHFKGDGRRCLNW